MSDLLASIALRASTEPCQVPRADLLELLERAGLGGSHAHDLIAAKPEGAVLLGRAGVLEALRLAEARERPRQTR